MEGSAVIIEVYSTCIYTFLPFYFRLTKKWSDSGAVARLSSRLNKIKGALRAQPVEGHAYDTDSTLDLGGTEFVSAYHHTLYLDIITHAHLISQ
jgi:hypothetical protein